MAFVWRALRPLWRYLKRGVPYRVLGFAFLLAMLEGLKVVAGFEGLPGVHQVTALTFITYFTFIVAVVGANRFKKIFSRATLVALIFPGCSVLL